MLPHWRIQARRSSKASHPLIALVLSLLLSFHSGRAVLAQRRPTWRQPSARRRRAERPGAACPARLAPSRSTRAQRPPQPRGGRSRRWPSAEPHKGLRTRPWTETGGRVNPSPETLRLQGRNRDGRAAGKRRRLRACIRCARNLRRKPVCTTHTGASRAGRAFRTEPPPGQGTCRSPPVGRLRGGGGRR